MLGEGSEGWIMQGNNKRMGVTKIRWPHRYEESRAQRSSDTVGAPPASELRRTCKKRIINTRRLPTCAQIPSTTRGADATSVFCARHSRQVQIGAGLDKVGEGWRMLDKVEKLAESFKGPWFPTIF